jgi:2-methylcitrate dehydratase PrpD
VTVTESVVDWAWALAHEPPPDDVRVASARQITDALGTAVAGVRSGEGGFASIVADRFELPAEATRLDRDIGAPVATAAFVNGVMLHALDFDDTHAASLIHASAAVLPAALATAELVGATGSNLLDAVIIGNEFALRLGAVVPHAFHARGFHPTSVCGVFGGTLAAAWLMELDPSVAVAALGIAGSTAAGSLEFLSAAASTKQLHPGLAGQSAVMSAQLAAAGATGPNSIIEGPNGLFAAYLGRDIEPADVTADLGSTWQTTQIATKRYPCCHLSHASMDAALDLHAVVAEQGLDVIESITAVVHPDAVDIVCEPASAKADPTTNYEAKFSLPWSVALTVVDGSARVDSFAADRIRRDDVLSLAAKVHCRVGDAATGPAAAQDGLLEVTLTGGATQTVRAPGGKGGPDLPLTDHELVDKFVDNAGGQSGASQWARFLLRLDEADSGDLRELITGVAGFAIGTPPTTAPQ